MTDTPAVWSERQLRALTAIFATFVEPAYEGESERYANDAATVLTEVGEPSDLRPVSLALTLFALRGFERWPRDRREREMSHWANSRIARRRSFFQLVKRLATFFAYADPGPGGINPRWEAIGYSTPDHEVPADSPLEAALIRPAMGDEQLDLDAEIVVVGSGAGGGVVAARLAELGHEVLVLEAGEYMPEAALPRDERSAFDQLYLDHGLTASTDLAVSILAGAGVGGGTLINWTTCVLPPTDVRGAWVTDAGLEMAGAGGDDELERIRRELGFHAPPSIGPKDQAILDGAAALGWEAAPTERNADGCTDCGACSFGCRRGAKMSGPRLHLAMAAANGARVLPGARVDRLDQSARGTRLHGTHAGRPLTVRARTVVLAAGALRTPQILLRSGFDHQHIGRNLRLHPTSVIAARFGHRVEMWRDTMQAARSLEFLAEGFIIESAPGHPGLIAQSVPWTSAAQHADHMGQAWRDAPFIAIVRDTGSGRVALGRSGRARIEYRISDWDAEVARRGIVAAAELARGAGAERVVALGTPALEHDVTDDASFEAFRGRLRRADYRPNRMALFSAHQMGSARAGADARLSPCDPWGRVRGAENVYVADASLFPTALGVNPMVTIMWLAGRVATAVHEAGPA